MGIKFFSGEFFQVSFRNIFCDLAKGSIQPSIDSVEARRKLERINQKRDCQKFDKVFSANSKRAQQTAVLIANT